MLNPIAKRWVEALRSGKYLQGRAWLAQDYDSEQRYCCLGVLCELALEDGVVTKAKSGPNYDYVPTNGACAANDLLPFAVRDWAGLQTVDGHYNGPTGGGRLTTLNDQQSWSFNQIADLIESEPEGLFRDHSEPKETTETVVK